MSPVLVDFITAVLAALYLLDFEMGVQDLARRRWPRPVPYWARLLTSAFCVVPLLCWELYGVWHGMYYVVVSFVVILLLAAVVYRIVRRRYVKRKVRRQFAAASVTPTTPSTPPRDSARGQRRFSEFAAPLDIPC